MSKIPSETKKDLTKDQLRAIIESTTCLGIIRRQGKDAAGKPLESEYYYVPEMDTDEQRRLAVTDGLRKPSLRACRKQHKVSLVSGCYYLSLVADADPPLAILLEAPQDSLIGEYATISTTHYRVCIC